MDFPGPTGFIGRVQTFPIPFRAGRAGYLMALASLWLLAGCVTPSGSPDPDSTKVATLQVQAETAGAIVIPSGTSIPCRIQMINGVEAPASDSLKPGHHRVIVALGSDGNEYVGDVDLLIPAAKNYRLQAERNDEMITISLIETDTGVVAATSAAAVDQVMKFKVFVLQK